MGIGRDLGKIIVRASDEYQESILSHSDMGQQKTDLTKNRLFLGDNSVLFPILLADDQVRERFQCIYCDPPFYTGQERMATVTIESTSLGVKKLVKVPAYGDRFSGGMEDYLGKLAFQLFAIRDLLSDKGTSWIHLDWRTVHLAKILMDEIFGEKNFINEIIWEYKSGGSSKKRYSRKHDTILLYGKTDKYQLHPGVEKSYNRKMKPYGFVGVEEYEDDMGWYTLVNRKDVWSMDMLGRTSKERNGYATQKPETIIDRIIQASTKEGDLCGDFFVGSGTVPAVAWKNNRRWIGCDRSPLAIGKTERRLDGLGESYETSIIERRLDRISSNVLAIDVEPDFCGADRKNFIVRKYELDVEKLKLDSHSQSVISDVMRRSPKDLIESIRISDEFGKDVVKVIDVFGNISLLNI